MTQRRRPTDEEFEALKRSRDAALKKVISEICEKYGWDRSAVHVHISAAGGCYCACPDGPCQHVWDGPDYVGDNFMSATCSRCGMPAIHHDLRCAP